MRRVLVGLVLAVLIVGCGGDDDDTSGEGDGADAAAGATSAEICDQWDDVLAGARSGDLTGEALEQRVDALADAAFEIDDQSLFSALTDVSTELVEGETDGAGVAEVESACAG
jgi:hypothetical protein